MGASECFRRAAFFTAVLLVVAGSGVRAQETRAPISRAELQLSFAPLVEKAAPAVVNIYTRKVQRTRSFSPLFDDPFFRRFFGQGFGLAVPRERVQNSLGSGVIVRGDGLVVTNHHVIEGADEITLVLFDRREFDAELVGSDERTDLAVLRFDTGGETMPFLRFGDSDALKVGDLVLAIGNPFGVGQTVTSGIVSALARTQVGISDLNFFIQTDAAINPGNSGGALVGMDGALVGVNSAIYSKTGGSLGIGFAIPANMVRSVIAGVTDGGRLVRPWFGAQGQGVTAEIASSLGLDRPRGVLISKVFPGGPADRAGLGVGDVVVAVNGKAVNDDEALKFRVATLQVGGTAELKVWRRGREHRLLVELVAAPEDPPSEVTELSGTHPFSGATVANMSPALADELGRDGFEAGVIILQLRRASTADRLRFRVGDLVASVNGTRIESVRHLKAVMAKPAKHWRITIRRNGKTLSRIIER
ncbi:MAG: Do family serine endopeptidase [Rhodospirillales bacterium]|jgi:serine protease Do|nr:Do family serine endopeptidase [Rhodospirillales bacterium]